MPIDPLPSISRSDANFRTQVDDYFLTRLPAFSTQAEAARQEIEAASANAALWVAAGEGVSGAIATETHAATSKTTPADADELGISDSAASWGLKKLTFANLKAWIGGLFVSKSGDTINGNLSFAGDSRRIGGDFTNSTIASRTMVQTNAPASATSLGVVPKDGVGLGSLAGEFIVHASDGSNSQFAALQLFSGTAGARLIAGARGSAAYGPLSMEVGGSTRIWVEPEFGRVGLNTGTPVSPIHVHALYAGTRPSTSNVNPDRSVIGRFQGYSTKLEIGAVDGTSSWIQSRSAADNAANQPLLLNPNGGAVLAGGALGYGVGAGGSVSQTDSKSAAVTINKPCGQITMHNESLAAGASVEFALNNTLLGPNDGLVVNPNGFAGYAVEVAYFSTATSVVLRVTNKGATRSDPVAILFRLIKGAAS